MNRSFLVFPPHSNNNADHHNHNGHNDWKHCQAHRIALNNYHVIMGLPITIAVDAPTATLLISIISSVLADWVTTGDPDKQKNKTNILIFFTDMSINQQCSVTNLSVWVRLTWWTVLAYSLLLIYLLWSILKLFLQMNDYRHNQSSLDVRNCTMMEELFPVPTSFTATTTTSSVSPSLLTLYRNSVVFVV